MNTFGGGIQAHIHQIWIGPNPRPDLWIDTIREFCNENMIQHTIWSEEIIEKYLDWDLIPGLKKLYEGYESLAGKGDILRYLILYQFGGLYIDADSVLINPPRFKQFLAKNRAGLFMAWEEFGDKDKEWLDSLANKNTNLKGVKRLIANGTIGAKQGHPFMKLLLTQLQVYAKEHAGKEDWRLTGPAFVTNVWNKHKHKFHDIKIYPMKYFYPIAWKGIKDPLAHTNMNFPPESMFFQYGYSTNKFDKIFKRILRKTRKRKH